MEEQEIVDDLPVLTRVYVDTNHYYHSNDMPAIRASYAIELGLVPGQRVIAYMPTDPLDVWPGVVGYDGSLPEWCQWWVELEG